MAGWTGLEPATFCVTGRRSNQLSYHPLVGRTITFRTPPGSVKREFSRIDLNFPGPVTPDFALSLGRLPHPRPTTAT